MTSLVENLTLKVVDEMWNRPVKVQDVRLTVEKTINNCLNRFSIGQSKVDKAWEQSHLIGYRILIGR